MILLDCSENICEKFVVRGRVVILQPLMLVPDLECHCANNMFENGERLSRPEGDYAPKPSDLMRMLCPSHSAHGLDC